MILEEIYNENNTIQRLIKIIDFTTQPRETRLIQQRLRKKGINPTIKHIKRHLLQYLLAPLDEIPEPERTVILRYQKNDNQLLNQSGKSTRFKRN